MIRIFLFEIELDADISVAVLTNQDDGKLFSIPIPSIYIFLLYLDINLSATVQPIENNAIGIDFDLDDIFNGTVEDQPNTTDNDGNNADVHHGLDNVADQSPDPRQVQLDNELLTNESDHIIQDVQTNDGSARK